MTIGSFITLLAGFSVPFASSWASLAHLLSLGFLGSFPNSAFPWAFTNFFGLLRLNYLIPHLWGLWTCYQSLTFFTFITFVTSGCCGPFSLFYIIYCPWVCFFSLLGSFRPVYFLKAYLFISWACNPLFLSFGLNGFFLSTY